MLQLKNTEPGQLQQFGCWEPGAGEAAEPIGKAALGKHRECIVLPEVATAGWRTAACLSPTLGEVGGCRKARQDAERQGPSPAPQLVAPGASVVAEKQVFI